MPSKIKVLVIDDSLLFREVLARGLSSDDQIDVVAKAADPFEALGAIIQFKPDVITCDVEMPRMNGIEFVKRLMPQYPVPVIIVSSLNGLVIDAMNAGAVSYVSKPYKQESSALNLFIVDLIANIKGVYGAKAIQSQSVIPKVVRKMHIDDQKLIAIGASTGGTQALSQLILSLPYNMPGIVIVQHIPQNFSKMFAERMDAQSHFKVVEAENGMYIKPNHVFIAPGGKHMCVLKTGSLYKIRIFEDEKMNGHCPSVDVLFHSVAKYTKRKAIGIILTGMGSDGAKGLLHLKQQGGRTIGQDEESSVVYGMPKAAYKMGAVDRQLPLSGIANAICDLLRT